MEPVFAHLIANPQEDKQCADQPGGEAKDINKRIKSLAKESAEGYGEEILYHDNVGL